MPVASTKRFAPLGSSNGHQATIPEGGGTQGFVVQPPAGAITVKYTTHEAVFEAQSTTVTVIG